MDATDYFKHTALIPASDGGVIGRPSMLINSGYIAARVAIAVALVALYAVLCSVYPLPAYALAIAFLPLFSIINLVARTRAIEYEIKGDKLIFREGFIGRHTGAVNIGRIQNAEVNQSFLEQIFSIGTVTVNTDDSTVNVIWMIGMKKPDELRSAILEASEAVRKERGLYEFVNP